jgi:hypothetical protein
MSNEPETVGQPQGRGLQDGTGTIEIRKLYGGESLPPGAVPVEKRVLARYVTPGAANEPHGIPPIGVIGLPVGWVIAEMYTDDDELHVLPFRFPWWRRAYALRCGDRLCAVVRNVQQMELAHGNQVVVQYNERRDYNAIFGRIEKLTMLGFDLRTPDGRLLPLGHEEVQFVGKVIAWWDDQAERDAFER